MTRLRALIKMIPASVINATLLASTFSIGFVLGRSNAVVRPLVTDMLHNWVDRVSPADAQRVQGTDSGDYVLLPKAELSQDTVHIWIEPGGFLPA